MNALPHAIAPAAPFALPRATSDAMRPGSVNAKGREGKGPEGTRPQETRRDRKATTRVETSHHVVTYVTRDPRDGMMSLRAGDSR